MITVKNYSANSFTLAAPFLFEATSKSSMVVRTSVGWDVYLLIRQNGLRACIVVSETDLSFEEVIPRIEEKLREHGLESKVNQRELLHYMELCDRVVNASRKRVKCPE